MAKALNIERVSLMDNVLGLLGACAVVSHGYDTVFIVNKHITVLVGRNGYSFKDHKTGKPLSKEMQKLIIRCIKKNQEK